MYSYQCQECNHGFDGLHSIAEMHLPTTEPCPACQAEGTVIKTIGGAFAIGDPVRLGVRRIDNGFKEVLQRIGAANIHSNLYKKW
jgi:putative FmdB family regulatory protein